MGSNVESEERLHIGDTMGDTIFTSESCMGYSIPCGGTLFTSEQRMWGTIFTGIQDSL